MISNIAKTGNDFMSYKTAIIPVSMTGIYLSVSYCLFIAKSAVLNE
ncbi:hypothetical protein CRENPOLYSF1_510010 [Crenothrix polyspora]|uniref:Uncharacterized protein n=1 Tax=Crenothrix polyspora TaxID=360316 RepID=A0A1R4HDF5_9GAMM|nr:hypothetical protein CRENPOLYSF1_510010 [Crenothrix polyspora]